MRKEYELSPEDLKALLEASKPTPGMFLSGGEPMGGTPRENAERAWRILGDRLGFDGMSVEPSPKGQTFFTAIPK